MPPSLIWFIVPVVVGLCQPVIWQMNMEVMKRSGMMEASTILHAVGTTVGMLWLLGGLRAPGPFTLGAVPWWGWLGGAVGMTCMAAMNRTIPVLGVSAALALLVATQFMASLAFEHFGWMGTEMRAVSLTRVSGAALMAVGAWLITRR